MGYEPFPQEFIGEYAPVTVSQESQMTTGSLDDFLELTKTKESVNLPSNTASGSATSKSETGRDIQIDVSVNTVGSYGQVKCDAPPESSSDDDGVMDWLEESSSDGSTTLVGLGSSKSLLNFEMDPFISEREDEITKFEPLFDLDELSAQDWKTDTAPMNPPPTVQALTCFSKSKDVKANTRLPTMKNPQFNISESQISHGKGEDPQPKRERKVYDAPFGQRSYFHLTEQDVGLGRGGEMNRHPGNLKFHEAKRRKQPQYKAAFKDSRTNIAQALVDEVHGWGGRFLKKDKLGYYEVHNHTARTKCSQALREDYTREQRAAKREKFRRLRKQQNQE